jgi:23S rRNA pseudouridine1911/1915/1917 synthase
MVKPAFIELGAGARAERIPILHEDRSILALDKPAGWMLIPFSWQQTQRNLQAAITSSIAAGDFWARSRQLKFLRHVHRLDGETTGILLFAKSPGAVETYSRLFESRRIEKTYLAVVQGIPKQNAWTCRLKLAPVPGQPGKMKAASRNGKEAETRFRLFRSHRDESLVEVSPITGRTHQIRVHLAEAGLPIVGDELYGATERRKMPPAFPIGLRAICVQFKDPFTRRPVRIQAPQDAFLAAFGFNARTTSPAETRPSFERRNAIK